MSDSLTDEFAPIGVPEMMQHQLRKCIQRVQNYPDTYKEIYWQHRANADLEPASNTLSMPAIHGDVPVEPVEPDPNTTFYRLRVVEQSGWPVGVQLYDELFGWDWLGRAEGEAMLQYNLILRGELNEGDVGVGVELQGKVFARKLCIVYKLAFAAVVFNVFNLDDRGRPVGS
jgi:hypothetical protein